MSTLGKAVIEFSADTAKFTGDVGRAEAVFGRAVSGMQSRLADLRNLAIAAAGIGGIAAMIKSSIDTADQLGKLSQKIGVSVERLSELKFAASLADTNLEAFTKGMRGFNQALVEAQDENSKAAGIFRALGVDILAGPDKALRQFADGLSQLKDGELKTTLATEVLKKGGLELIPMLNQGSRGLDEMGEKARRLGLIMSAETAKRAEEFNDNLKELASSSAAFAAAASEGALPALTTITKRLTEAKEQGELLLGIFKELAKITLATGASIVPKWTETGKMLDRLAEWTFTQEERIRGQREMGKNLLDRIHGKGATPPPEVNGEALACALSGGKWENGQCVRAGAKGARDSSAADYARSLQAQQDMMDEANRLGADFLLNQQKIIDEHNQRLQEADIAGWVAHAQSVFDAAEAEQLALARIAAEAEKTSDIARDLGMSFSSAFEDAVVGGKRLSDVIRSLEMDIMRLVTRELVTKPFAKAITDAVTGSSVGKAVGSWFGSIFGGGKAAGGPVSPGTAYMVGERGPELFVPNIGGQIVPSGATMPAPTILFNISTPDANSFRAARSQIAADMARALQSAQRNL